jgi:hypothetical protein
MIALIALIALIGVAAVPAGAMAQETGEDGVPPAVRAAEPGWSAGVTPGGGDGNRGGVGASGRRAGSERDRAPSARRRSARSTGG